MRTRAVRIGTALVLTVMLGAACGARVTEQQVASLGGGQAVGGGGVATAAGPTTGGDGAGSPAATGSDVAAVSGGDAAAAPTGNDAGGAGPAASGGGGDGAPAATDPSATAAGTAQTEARTASDVGITANEIVLGHVTQLSGPVPGLFEGSAIGANAFAAYMNSKGGLAGRQVKVDVRDDQFDASQNRAVTNDLIKKTFALVGGVSLYDDASAPEVKASGIPDIPGLALNKVRADLPNSFPPAPNADHAATGQFLWFKRKFPEAIKAVGSIYGDVPSAKRSHENFRKAAETLGYKWEYDRGYQPTETDFSADIIRMRQSGVKAVFVIAADAKNVARLLRAADQQGWEPDVWILGASAYDRVLLKLAGPAAEGVHIFSTYALYQGEDAATVPEVKLFNQWVQRVRPGRSPDLYAAAAWTSGRLLEQAIAKAGPNPTRQSVNAALRTITKFSGNGIQAEADPAGKVPSTCYFILTVKDGKYRRIEPADKGFICEGTIFRRR